MRKNLTFYDQTDNSRLNRELYEMAAAFEQAGASAAGLENRILGLQIGSTNLIRILAGAAQALANLFRFPSKGADTKAKQLKTVGKAAKEAKKELAAFDEINRLGAPEIPGTDGMGTAASSGGTGFGSFDLTRYKELIDEMTVYVSGALLGLGAILAFSGANIPLGLGLMAAGAVGLAAVVWENWEAMGTGVKTALTRVLTVLGAGALGLGAILAFSGVNIPLGLGLMAAGAAGLVTAARLNWDAIPEKIRGIWQGIVGWFSANVAPKLTKAYWQEKFSAISEGLTTKIRDGINTGITLLNRFISWVNGALFLHWGGLSAFGQTIIPAGSFQLLTIPSIPMLAQGAVIPPNAPFLAMLGDQKSGNNIEAPEELIRRIVREEAGSADTELLREQNELLRQILDKSGTYLDGREITRTVSRYQRLDARAMGV